jgi:hypothetical protein
VLSDPVLSDPVLSDPGPSDGAPALAPAADGAGSPDADVARFCRANGINRQPSIRDCLRFLEATYPQTRMEYRDHYFYYYGNYYAAQAMHTRGGAAWNAWYARVRDDLLEAAERSDGTVHWRSLYVGDVFSTSVAAIILQVPKNYLPIFQR